MWDAELWCINPISLIRLNIIFIASSEMLVSTHFAMLVSAYSAIVIRLIGGRGGRVL